MTEGASQLTKFLLAGGVAAAVNVAARYLLDFLMPFSAAVVLAYLVGMTTAFVLNKRFVFEKSSLQTRDEFIRFGIVNAFAAAQVWLVSVGLAEHVFPWAGFSWRPHDVAHVIGVLFPVATSYVLHKRFSFEKKPGAS